MKRYLDSNRLIETCIALSYDQKEGCLFAIETGVPRVKYYKFSKPLLYKRNGKKISRLSLFNKSDLPVIKKLASLDGAMIINRKGELVSISATLIHSYTYLNHGKRHAFALGTTRVAPEVVCVLASEEDRKIRVFKEGVCYAEIDVDTRMSLSAWHKLSELLSSKTSHILISSSIAASVLTANPIPALITITGAQAIVAGSLEAIKKFAKK